VVLVACARWSAVAAEGGQWANFLRNYDELNVGRLPPADQQTVFEAFAPDGDRDRIELAYSLLFSLPGTPLLVYGDEIGMGDDLSLTGRNSVRTPMQWSSENKGGFSTADPEELIRPVVSGGEYGYEEISVADQRGDPDSLLQWFSRLNRLHGECPEIGHGDCEVLATDDPVVFAHRMVSDYGRVPPVHNLAAEPTEATLELAGEPTRLFGEAEFEKAGEGESESGVGEWRFDVGRYGYCWVRVEKDA
jgi:maltose alpha-D-glucosyltransferase/alpha-amylase